MQRYLRHWIMVMAGITLFAACGGEQEDELTTDNQAVCFRLSRSGDSQNQLLRALIAERSVDNAVATDGGLYCGLDKRYFLPADATTFMAENLKLQWYKFAFLAVPDIETKIDGEKLFSDVTAEADTEEAVTEDFNKLLLDYTPVLQLQEEEQDAATTYDLNLYRGVVDRQTTRPAEGGETPNENVTLKHINGEFKLDLGILQDQFEHEVSDISLSLNVPKRVYIYDNYREYQGEGDNVESESDVYVESGNNYNMTYNYKVGELATSKTDHCVLTLDLLPCTLDATLMINFVQPADGGSIDARRYVIYSDEATSLVEIKPNVRTTLLFNGMHRGEFEVRYAGFDGSSIGVADDEWNGGWN